MSKFSFKKGYDQVQRKDLESVKQEIMSALEINNRMSWNDRLNGNVEPRISEHRAIEEIFNKRGITEIWGE